MPLSRLWAGTLALVIVLSGGWAAAEDAGVHLTARLVSASMDASSDASEPLADVLPLFQENLKFNTYRLVCKRAFDITDGLRVKLERDMTLVLGEARKNQCTVQVERHGKPLLTSRFRFDHGHPVVLGGFPEDNGNTLIIVLAPE